MADTLNRGPYVNAGALMDGRANIVERRLTLTFTGPVVKSEKKKSKR